MRRELFPWPRSRIPCSEFLISRWRAATQDLSHHSPLTTPPGRLQQQQSQFCSNCGIYWFVYVWRSWWAPSLLVPRHQTGFAPYKTPQRVFREWDLGAQEPGQKLSALLLLLHLQGFFPSSTLGDSTFSELGPKNKRFLQLPLQFHPGRISELPGSSKGFSGNGKGRQTLQNPPGHCGCLLGNVVVKKPIIALIFRFSADLFITVLHGGKNLPGIHKKTWSPAGDKVISVTCGSRSYL